MSVNDPEILDLIADQWTPVAINAINGAINILKEDVVYYQTYRLTGNDSPSNIHAPGDTDFEGIVIYNRRDRIAGQEIFTGGLQFSATAEIDVYIYATGAGKVRIDKLGDLPPPPAGGDGDMVGPESSIINEIFTAADETGKLAQTTVVTIHPTTGDIANAGQIEHSGKLYRKAGERIIATADGKSTGALKGDFFQTAVGHFTFRIGSGFIVLLETGGFVGPGTMWFRINSTREATGLGSGAFMVTGGASIAKKLWVGEDIHTNGSLFSNSPSGATQAAAGAAAGEEWITSGHAILPDGVKMRGA